MKFKEIIAVAEKYTGWSEHMVNAYLLLSKHGELGVREDQEKGVAHVFFPKEYLDCKSIDDQYLEKDGKKVYRFSQHVSVSRPTLTKLIIAGYAEYVDKKRTTVRFVDKDTAEDKKDRIAMVGQAVLDWFENGSFNDSNGKWFTPYFDLDDLVRWGKWYERRKQIKRDKEDE